MFKISFKFRYILKNRSNFKEYMHSKMSECFSKGFISFMLNNVFSPNNALKTYKTTLEYLQ